MKAAEPCCTCPCLWLCMNPDDDLIHPGHCSVPEHAKSRSLFVTSPGLAGNQMGVDGVKALAEALKGNATIQTLNLQSMPAALAMLLLLFLGRLLQPANG